MDIIPKYESFPKVIIAEVQPDTPTEKLALYRKLKQEESSRQLQRIRGVIAGSITVLIIAAGIIVLSEAQNEETTNKGSNTTEPSTTESNSTIKAASKFNQEDLLTEKSPY